MTSLDLFDLLHAGEPDIDHFTYNHFSNFLTAAGQYQDPDLIQDIFDLFPVSALRVAEETEATRVLESVGLGSTHVSVVRFEAFCVSLYTKSFSEVHDLLIEKR